MGWAYSFALRRERGLEQIEPGAAIAGINPRRHADAREQWPVWIEIVEFQAHRQSLDDLDPVSRRVLGRQEREVRAGPRTHADDARLELAIGIGIDVDRRLLARAHMIETGLAKIRLDPDVPARQQRERRCPGID